MTAAKIGRSMKKCERFIGPSRRALAGRLGAGGAFCGVVPCSGVTFWPGRARSSPPMMTLSSAVMPLLTMRRLSSITGPSSTGFGTTVPSGATVNSNLIDWSVTTAASGTSMARMELRHRHRDAPELARGDEVVGVGECRAHADGAGRCGHIIVDEIDFALQGPVVLVHELALHHRLVIVPRRLDLALRTRRL